MSLHASMVEYVGKTLYVRPIFGWGWQGNAEAPIEPAEFEIELSRLFQWRGELRGGVGNVKSADHQLTGRWIVFSTREDGSFDFSNTIGRHNVKIGGTEPVENEEGWPVFEESLALVTGFAEIISPDRPC